MHSDIHEEDLRTLSEARARRLGISEFIINVPHSTFNLVVILMLLVSLCGKDRGTAAGCARCYRNVMQRHETITLPRFVHGSSGDFTDSRYSPKVALNDDL